jgi:hypothetical protein
MWPRLRNAQSLVDTCGIKKSAKDSNQCVCYRRVIPELQSSPSSQGGVSWAWAEGSDIRLYRVTQRIQEILNLACLLPDRIQWTRVVHRVSSARSSKVILASQVVACRTANLCHCRSPAGSAPNRSGCRDLSRKIDHHKEIIEMWSGRK